MKRSQIWDKVVATAVFSFCSWGRKRRKAQIEIEFPSLSFWTSLMKLSGWFYHWMNVTSAPCGHESNHKDRCWVKAIQPGEKKTWFPFKFIILINLESSFQNSRFTEIQASRSYELGWANLRRWKTHNRWRQNPLSTKLHNCILISHALRLSPPSISYSSSSSSLWATSAPAAVRKGLLTRNYVNQDRR